jgi:hypothetical protein
VSLRRTFGWFGHAVALIVDPLIVWIGVGVILNGDWFGAVIGLFGAYLLAQEIAILVHRRWRAERLMAFFGLSFFFVLTAWWGSPLPSMSHAMGRRGLGLVSQVSS